MAARPQRLFWSAMQQVRNQQNKVEEEPGFNKSERTTIFLSARGL